MAVHRESKNRITVLLMASEDENHPASVQPDRNLLFKLAQAVMPYGRYAGRRLVDLPENYIIWFSQRGFPTGELGELLRTVYEIKVNGLEYLFKNIK